NCFCSFSIFLLVGAISQSSSIHSELKEPRYFVATVVAAIFLLPIHLFVPLNSDNDLYQAMAVALVKGKGLPYIGSWDVNFPGIVYIHALGIALFGNTDVGFRI